MENVCYSVITVEPPRRKVMKRFDVSKLVETNEVDELKKQINELLHILERGETVDLMKRGKVFVRVKPESVEKLTREQEIKAFWEKIDELAAEVGSHLPENAKVDAVEIIREMRREF